MANLAILQSRITGILCGFMTIQVQAEHTTHMEV
jgi:hypothetical protein